MDLTWRTFAQIFRAFSKINYCWLFWPRISRKPKLCPKVFGFVQCPTLPPDRVILNKFRFELVRFFLLGLWFITSLNVVTLVCIEWPLRFTPISCINDQFCFLSQVRADESPANCRKLWYHVCKLLATYLANWFLMVLGVWRKGHKVKFRVRVTESREEKWQVESGLKVD